MTTIPSGLTGRRFSSFAEVAKAIHAEDIKAAEAIRERHA